MQLFLYPGCSTLLAACRGHPYLHGWQCGHSSVAEVANLPAGVHACSHHRRHKDQCEHNLPIQSRSMEQPEEQSRVQVPPAKSTWGRVYERDVNRQREAGRGKSAGIEYQPWGPHSFQRELTRHVPGGPQSSQWHLAIPACTYRLQYAHPMAS